ncbi:hypothetical protein AURDEDRAFT_162155 [Auricularia subglabra TFB-10046 SS5]|nr:hypothetical protein AURDEDRAFT_162155 [Auricularia subglabra TFB-10046 SS5]
MRYSIAFLALLGPGVAYAQDTVRLSRSNRRPQVNGLPDWSRAGYEGGNDLPDDSLIAYTVGPAELSQFYGVRPNDGLDDTAGLEKVLADMKTRTRNGVFGLLQLPAGVLNLKYTLYIDANYVIIRGAGSDPNAGGTVLEFRPDNNTLYDVLEANGSRWSQSGMKTDWKYEVPDENVGTGVRTVTGSATSGWLWPGRSMFRVGSKEVAAKFVTPHDLAADNRKDLFFGTVNYHWRIDTAVKGFMADQTKDISGFAGTNKVYFDNHNTEYRWAPGDDVWIAVPVRSTDYDDWNVQNKSYYVNEYMYQDWFTVIDADVDADGSFLILDHDLAFNVYSSSVSSGAQEMEGKVSPAKIMPVEKPVHHVGIENLYITQPMDGLNPADAVDNYGNMAPEAAMHGIVFRMTGSHPIATEATRFLQIQDNYFDGSWNKGAGGNGYLRGSRVWDSLYFNNTLRNLRHFTFQWCAMRNVALYNDMTNDFNLHGGWEGYNLAELNSIQVAYAHRAQNCRSNCGGEGGSTEGGTWAPIYWSTGNKASKWSGASGPQNVFFRNWMIKEFTPGSGYDDYLPYFTRGGSLNPRIWQFGWDRDFSYYQHLTLDGSTPLPDWQSNERAHFHEDPAKGVNGLLSDGFTSLFLRDVSGLRGPLWFSLVEGSDICPADSDGCVSCPRSLRFPNGSDPDDIFSRALAGADESYAVDSWANISARGNLARRGPNDFSAWKFAQTDQFLILTIFLRALYRRGQGNGDAWVTTQQPAESYVDIVTNPIGNANLRPAAGETGPVVDQSNPSWSIMEAWRPLNLYRSLVTIALAIANNPAEIDRRPVREYLRRQIDQGDATAPAYFPPQIRQLLTDNEDAIVGSSADWVGRNVNIAGQRDVPPFPGVQVAYGRSTSFYQRGSIGPVSMEVAFILATQVAGVNWQTIAQRAVRTRVATWSVGGLLPANRRFATDDEGTCISTSNARGTSERTAALVLRQHGASPEGDGDVGFYIAIDLDPDMSIEDPAHNVFLFVVHTSDPHSRINIPNPEVLRAMTFTQYTPAAGESTAPYPGTPGQPPQGPSDGRNVRFMAHAHSAVMRYSDWARFLEQPVPVLHVNNDPRNPREGISIPLYTEVSYLHFYILSETEWEGWDRSEFRGGGN